MALRSMNVQHRLPGSAQQIMGFTRATRCHKLLVVVHSILMVMLHIMYSGFQFLGACYSVRCASSQQPSYPSRLPI